MSISRLFCASLLGLGLLAGTAHADMSRVGPVRAADGFPSWYQDLEGLVLDPCLPDASDPGNQQAAACLVFPGPPDPPFTFPGNFPDELFYFRAVSDDVATGAGKRAVLVLAVEGAFANEVPAAGDQVVFTRIRVTAGVPFSGTYTVTHPYGVEVFPDVVAGQGNRDIVFTEDVGVAAGDFTGALRSRVGPFLTRADANGLPLGPVTINGAQFLSDGATPTFLTGSPFNTNFFEICGPFDGPGSPDRCIRQPLFTLTGRLHDNANAPIASPLSIDQATYARSAAGIQVDVSASALPGIGRATPRLSMGASGMSTVLMRGPDALGLYFGQGLPATQVPSTVTVINDADPLPSTVTANVVDRISVTAADYDASARSLVVIATSSDKGSAAAAVPTLVLDGFPDATVTPVAIPGDPSSYRFAVAQLNVPPARVTVNSSYGGSGQRIVSPARAPAFPAGVPLAQDDSATATAGGAAVVINVKANDIASAAAPINAGAVTIVAPGLMPAIGSLTANANGTVTFTPTLQTGTAAFLYTVNNAVGRSSAALVTITVNAPAGGPVPIPAPDPTPGNAPLTANAGSFLIINVLANDSANGGTINPASVQVVTPPNAGSAIAQADGTVRFNAPATAGSFTFSYRVANTLGVFSQPANVTVTVVAQEAITVNRARCQAPDRWDIRGTSNVPSSTVTVFTTPTVPTNPTAAQIIGSQTVDATGAFQLQVRGGPACTASISLRTAVGTRVNNIAVTR